MLNVIKNQLQTCFPKELIDQLFSTYTEVKRKYCLNDYRPCCIEGGRFAEIVLRMLQYITQGNYTSLKQNLPNFTDEVFKLSQLPSSAHNDSIRIHIPRAIQVIYDIRNKRNIGHVGGDIDANFTDATLSYTLCNWVVAELLRIYYTSDIQTAQKLVNDLVKIKIPIVQEINGFLKILAPKMSIANKILSLLYCMGSEGATKTQLKTWIKKVNESTFQSSLSRLEYDKAFIHIQEDIVLITDAGTKFVEEKIFEQFQI